MGDDWKLNAAYVDIMRKRLEDVVLEETAGTESTLGVF
jgi:hypothetical protein